MTDRTEAGFTLVELAAVLALTALVFQLVTMNLGAMIPAHALDSGAAQIVSQVDFLRSEAKLQGKTYKLEFDLDRRRYRVILPKEDELVAYEVAEEGFDLGWQELGDQVHVSSCAVAGRPTFRSGRYQVVFDANGFTADQTIFVEHAHEEGMVWSIQIRGLTGQAEIVRSMEGVYEALPLMEEGRF